VTPVPELITSTANPRIRALTRLRRRRERDATGRFLIEGCRELERAVGAGVVVEELIVCPRLLDADRTTTVEQLVAVGLTITAIAEEPFHKVCYRQHPDGVLGVARQPDTSLDRLAVGDRPLVLVVAGIEKPGNLGAMLRIADGAGANAVVVADAGTDVFNPNVVRASQGALFATAMAITSAADAISWATRHSLRLVAGFPDAATDYWDADLTGSAALVVGSEHSGLPRMWDDACVRVRIPMAGIGDSLNAATAAGLLLYEAVRQRRA